MTSPDISSYVDLTVYDADPTTLVNRMVLNAQQLLPDWQPTEGLTEMAVAESLSLIIAELVFAVNRLPSATVQTLLQLFGITRGTGTQATATVTFTIAGNSGATIPQGTALQVVVGSRAYLFTVNTDLTIPSGSSSGTANVTCTTPAAGVNGVATGTSLTILSPQLAIVNQATFATSPAGGVDPETVTAWLNRGMTVLQGITTALVVPSQFTKAALTATVDSGGNLIYDSDLARVNNGTNGSWSLAGGTYGTANGDWQVSTTGTWEYLGSGAAAGSESVYSQVIQVTPASEYTLTATVDATNVTAGSPAVKVTDTGRATTYLALTQTAGSNSSLTGSFTVPAGVTQVVVVCDIANATVTAAQPATWSALNLIPVGGPVTAAFRATTVDNWDPTLNSGAGGSAEGSVTVAVMGEGGVYLTDTQKSEIQTALSNNAVAGLAVHVVDPAVTIVDVTCSVWQEPGYTVAQVQQNVLDNLTAAAAPGAGISTDNWPWSATLRMFDIATAIRTAPGVSYLVSLSAPSADVSLPGTAPLAALGTVTVSVEGP